jgi:uncharacterized protein YybS (DUF2232 family)
VVEQAGAPSQDLIDALMATVNFFQNELPGLQTLTVVLLVLGIIALIVTGIDWGRRRFGHVPPGAAVVVGGILSFIGFLVYGNVGRFFVIQQNTPTAFVLTDYQPMYEAAQVAVASASGWGVISMTAGLLFLMLGVAGVVKNVLTARRLAAAARGTQHAAA